MTEKCDAGTPGPPDPDGDSAEGAPGTAVATVDLPFPGYVATAFYRLPQTSWPRRWCLTMISWPYPSLLQYYDLAENLRSTCILSSYLRQF